VIGQVTKGMDVVDTIKLGKGSNGAVIGQPDAMMKVSVID
jgi:peptidylprolyl isomerase